MLPHLRCNDSRPLTLSVACGHHSSEEGNISEAFWALQLEEHPANFAEHVADAVRTLGVTPYLRADAAGHLIDVLVQLRKPDAQVQGGSNKPGDAPSPLGHSVLKHRHLKRQGFHVVHLTWNVWRKLTTHQQLALLQREIERAQARKTFFCDVPASLSPDFGLLPAETYDASAVGAAAERDRKGAST
ncbi:hypothetical protein EPH_0030810 [Eimeria praecox]|uniref:RAP domain-containing protein n=1 Tax=Eimeria praecox TaxID=51316 RepID=U6G1C6_9EIME|nr:hypothetical protein EPH_0030810 [Eimeria praecox]